MHHLARGLPPHDEFAAAQGEIDDVRTEPGPGAGEVGRDIAATGRIVGNNGDVCAIDDALGKQ